MKLDLQLGKCIITKRGWKIILTNMEQKTQVVGRLKSPVMLREILTSLIRGINQERNQEMHIKHLEDMIL